MITVSRNNNNVLLNVGLELTGVLRRANASIENLFVIACYWEDKLYLLDNYLSERTNDQRLVFLQELVRKQLLQTEKTYEELSEDFTFRHFNLSGLGEEVAGIITGQAILPEIVENSALLKAVDNLVLNNEQKEKLKFDNFLKDFINKFPEGKKNNGGKMIRTNIEDVRKKMIAFFNKYKRYNNFTLILNATDKFLSDFKGDYSYCPTAEYFISKNGTSALATECEGILSGGRGGTQNNISNPFEKLM